MIYDEITQVKRCECFFFLLKNDIFMSSPRLSNLPKSEDKADMLFKINDEVIHAHKMILELDAPILTNFC